MKKLKYIIAVMFLLMGLFIFLGIKFSSCKLFQYNLMEIVTTICVSFGIYYLTKLGEDKKSKNNKIEDIITLIQKKLVSTFSSPITKDNKAEYLHTFKYLDNKICILENMSKHLKCDEEIRNIKVEKEKLDDFITENIDLGDDYFKGKSVKEKIPNILCNIETHLDSIILKIYGTTNKSD